MINKSLWIKDIFSRIKIKNYLKTTKQSESGNTGSGNISGKSSQNIKALYKIRWTTMSWTSPDFS